MASIREMALKGSPPKREDLDLALESGKAAEVEQLVVQGILQVPWNSTAVAAFAKERARALLAENKPQEALSAAKAYYDVARLGSTADAIRLVGLCLAKAHPEDNDIARRFKKQQLAWAATQPSSDPTLGEPILPSIPVDGSPYANLIDTIQLDDTVGYVQYLRKGNLLLVAGRAKEARAAFEDGLEIAEGRDVQFAIENVARAIRAESGCVGSANAYILSQQDK